MLNRVRKFIYTHRLCCCVLFLVKHEVTVQPKPVWRKRGRVIDYGDSEDKFEVTPHPWQQNGTNLSLTTARLIIQPFVLVF